MLIYVLRLNVGLERYRSGHNGAVLKTVGGQPSVGSNPTLSATSAESFEVCGGESDVQFNIQLISVCGSTQVAEGAPLLRE